MLELDILLQGFVDNGYSSLQTDEQELFQALLSLPDQELFDILMETRQPEKKEFSRVIAKIRHATTT
jgi:succinate dehydrogenase flavin-adding protein (antitoxin of CptAB toxin-antitoxin module)